MGKHEASSLNRLEFGEFKLARWLFASGRRMIPCLDLTDAAVVGPFLCRLQGFGQWSVVISYCSF